MEKMKEMLNKVKAHVEENAIIYIMVLLLIIGFGGIKNNNVFLMGEGSNIILNGSEMIIN